MSSTTVIVSVATALAGAVAAVLGTSENEPRSVGGPEGGVELAPAQPADSVLLDVGSARRPEPETSNPTADSARASWAARFRESSDNAEFVARTLGAALAGDGEAKFYLYLALNECASAQVLFAGGSRPEDLPASDALSGEEAEALFRRCAGLADLPTKAQGR